MDNPIQRRPPVRADTQDGPWSVSVAESPHDPRSYSLYIKTPTLNLTLTRTAMEILDLDQKLRETNPNVKIPPLPINADSIPPPPKRKSNFLNTLSRLASPTSNKTARRNTNPPLPTPIASPSGEINDPFNSFSASNVNSPSIVAAPSATSTGIAAYLTTISNTASLRQARVWKRFVRVRTDDLESVRVERAIKRVRSDLAAHVGGLPRDEDDGLLDDDHPVTNGDFASQTDDHQHTGDISAGDESPHTPIEDSLPTPVQTPKELDEDDQIQVTESPGGDAINAQLHPQDEVTEMKNEEPSTATIPEPSTPPMAPENIPVPTTPSASEAHAQAPTQRIHRSHSADPDKSSRLSRAFAQSAPASQVTSANDMDGASSATGDDSSVSTSNKRKKRSKSTTTPREKKYKDKEPKKSQRKVLIDDFEMMRVLGKGCAGKVLLVKHKSTSDLYALKAITKRHVLAHQELQHTLTEQAVLKRMAAEGKDPFVVKLWWSFHDKENLFLVMDFHPGGDLATQLARWGRLGRDRARFYAAEIVEGVEGLHNAGVIYRDLKPENILIGSDGHIVLTDFGLSKEFPRRSTTASAPLTPTGEVTASAAWMKGGLSSSGGVLDPAGEQVVGWPGGPQDQTTTFCGTAEYLAPEVIQGLPYSYEVDWWSFGTMLYEMLTGITPFWANNHSDMYVRVLQDELQFPEDRAIDQDTKSLIRGLLQRNPALRICEPRIKRHPYFSMIDWSHVYYKRYIPPYIPPIDPSNASDTQNFDDTFLDMEPVLDEYVDETTDTDQDIQTDTDRTDGEDTATTPSQSRSSSIRPSQGQIQAQPQGQAQPQSQSGAVAAGVQLQLQLQQQQQQQQQQAAVEESVDVFDGYSFKGRHSVLIDSSDDDEEEEEEEEEEGTGSERTGLTEIGTESSEAGDSSSVLGSVVSPPETARPPLAVVEVEAEAEVEVKVEVTPEAGAEAREQEEEDTGLGEPKTPEARPAALPVASEPELVLEDIEKLMADAKKLEHKLEEGEPETPTEERPKGRELPVPDKVAAIPVQQQKSTAARPAAKNKRRERSGIPALDKDLPEDTEAGEDTEAAGGLDDEDDDWDFVEAVDGEDRNGAKGTSLFARGVVDRYRLAVFRKASTPSRAQQQRSVSGTSKASEVTVDGGSPSPTQRRGRAALAFRKGPRQFLQPKSSQTRKDVNVQNPPPSSYSSKKSRKSFGPSRQSTINSVSGAAAVATGTVNSMATMASGSSNTAGLLTPSLSMGSSAMMSPSLKSRESAASVGAQSLSSDQSGHGHGAVAGTGGVNGKGSGDVEHGVIGGQDAVKVLQSPVVEETVVSAEKTKTTKKLKKYKEGAEKVFSLFSSASSPRQHHHAS